VPSRLQVVIEKPHDPSVPRIKRLVPYLHWISHSENYARRPRGAVGISLSASHHM